MSKFFSDPRVRLAGRALVAGLAVGFTTLKAADDPFSKAALFGALGAGFMAAVELVTPLNALVGLGKQ